VSKRPLVNLNNSLPFRSNYNCPKIVDFVLKNPQASTDDGSEAEEQRMLEEARERRRQNFAATRKTIAQNLIFVNPTIFAILEMGKQRFNHFSLIDWDQLIQNKQGPFELRGFKAVVSQRTEKIIERLMSRFVSFLYLSFNLIQLAGIHTFLVSFTKTVARTRAGQPFRHIGWKPFFGQ
jgi:hypothetical protein